MKINTSDKNLSRIRNMIEKAAASVGGQNKLAAAIGYSKGQLSNWYAGREPCPAKAQAAMAPLAGMDGLEVMALATIEQEDDPRRKEVLLRALGKRFGLAGAAALFATFAAFGLAPRTAQADGPIDTMRRKVKWRPAPL